MAGVKKVREDAPEIEVDETRLIIEQEVPGAEHLLEGNEQRGELRLPLLAVSAPLVDAAAPEFSFLETEVVQLLCGGHELFEVGIVQPERGALHVIVDVAPENALQSIPLSGEKPQLQFRIEILGDHLGVLVRLEEDVPAVLDHRNLIVALLGEFPDQ